MSKYNITMKQKNDSDYDELYPESLDTQIKLSKDTTGFTGTNVNVIIFKEEPPVSWDNYSYYKLGGNYNLAFDDISLNNNILSISQASSYNYYVQGIVF